MKRVVLLMLAMTAGCRATASKTAVSTASAGGTNDTVAMANDDSAMAEAKTGGDAGAFMADKPMAMGVVGNPGTIRTFDAEAELGRAGGRDDWMTCIRVDPTCFNRLLHDWGEIPVWCRPRLDRSTVAIVATRVSISDVKGALDDAAARAALDEVLPVFRGCYQEGYAIRPLNSGRIEARVVIGPNCHTKVERVEARLPDDRARECMATSLIGLHPRGLGEAEATLAFAIDFSAIGATPSRSQPSMPPCREQARHSFGCWQRLKRIELPAAPFREGIVHVSHVEAEGYDAMALMPALLPYLDAKAVAYVRLCYEEGLVQNPGLKGEMTLRIGGSDAVTLQAQGLDETTQHCVRASLAGSGLPGITTVSLTFEPGRNLPPPTITEDFFHRRACSGQRCVESTIRELELHIRGTLGEREHRINLRGSQKKILDCWRSVAPNAHGTLLVALIAGADGSPISAQPVGSLAPQLDQCIGKALLPQGRTIAPARSLAAVMLEVRLMAR